MIEQPLRAGLSISSRFWPAHPLDEEIRMRVQAAPLLPAFLRRPMKWSVEAARRSLALTRVFLPREPVKQPTGTIPADALSYLTDDNARLRDLRRRYQGHPASNHTQWRPSEVRRGLDMQHFRADNMYLYQSRRYSPLAFYATAAFTKQLDRHGIFELLDEDDYFGAELFDFHGRAVSRDLLDSVIEINILSRLLPIATRPITILDVGSGYGRLAHRMTATFANVRYCCVDAVPESTFISEYYLKFRRADHCVCLPLDEITKTLPRAIDLAIKHSQLSRMSVQRHRVVARATTADEHSLAFCWRRLQPGFDISRARRPPSRVPQAC